VIVLQAIMTMIVVGFPIIMMPAFYMMLVRSLCVVLGIPAIRDVLKNSGHFLRFIGLIGSHQLRAIIYPAHQVLFQAASSTDYSLLVLLLLPVLKLIVKNICASSTTWKT
jgi:hypothetical protein